MTIETKNWIRCCTVAASNAASPDLAARIILHAQNLPQLQNVSSWQSLRQLFAEFHLPKPAYVLASALVLGMVMGFTTDSGQLRRFKMQF